MKSESDRRTDIVHKVLHDFFRREVDDRPHVEPPEYVCRIRWSDSVWGSFTDFATVAAVLLVAFLGLFSSSGKSSLAERLDDSAVMQQAFERSVKAADEYLPDLRF